MSSFRDLVVWQKAMDLVEEVYAVTRAFPADERYGLTAQSRRCAVSIPSNIAEGYGRHTTKDTQHFLAQARGSILELQTQLILATRLQIGEGDAVRAAIGHAEEVGRVLNGLMLSTARRPARKTTND